MENEPFRHGIFYLPPTPSRKDRLMMRHRSLSPSIAKEKADENGVVLRSPSSRRRSFNSRSMIPNSPSNSSLRSSPLASRTLNQLNSAWRDDFCLTPAHEEEETLKSQPLRLPSTDSPSVDPLSTSMCTSICSAPSSPFMELVYSASASTAETPDIFRQLDREDKETPIMANIPSHTRTNSEAVSLQSMIHESELSAPQSGVSKKLVVPFRLNANLEPTSTSVNVNNEKSSNSPYSLPSMLGRPDNSYDSEEVSELESPMLFSSTTEASDIQSGSEATEIRSLRTTPTQNLDASQGNNANGDDVDSSIVHPTHDKTSALDSPEHSSVELPGPIVRCDAQDELDAYYDNDCDAFSAATPNRHTASPSLSQLATNSGFFLSHQEVLEAAYESESREILSEDPFIRRLQQQHAQMTAIQRNTRTQKHKWMVHSRAFFQSPQTVQFTDVDGDDGMISELSSYLGDGRDIEHGAKPSSGEHGAVRLTTTMASSSGSASDTAYPRFFHAESKLGLLCRLVTILVLASSILAPMVGVFINSRQQEKLDMGARNSTNSHIDNGNIGLTRFPKPTKRPTTQPQPSGMGTAVPGGSNSSTAVPTSLTTTTSPTMTPTVAVGLAPSTRPSRSSTPSIASLEPPTPTPTVATAEPTETPSARSLPNLPPVHAIWEDTTWISHQEASAPGPRWVSSGSSPLRLTILNSLTDPANSIILEEIIEEWTASSVDLELVSDLPEGTMDAIGDCIPPAGKIRVCNGNFGDTTSRFFSEVYVNDEREIIAATILQNDEFGSDGSDLLDATPKSLAYNYCHELGHALGLFHTSRGCMVEHVSLDSMTEDHFVRPDPSDLETLDAMYGQQ